MSTRRSLKQPVASFRKSLKNDPRYREMLRRAARKSHMEALEARQMFAIDPVLVQADGGVAFGTGTAPTTVRNESPRELVFTFPAVPGMDRTTLANGIKLVGANKDNLFNANDVTITPAYLDLGNDPTQVVMRFATPLPDDLYRIQFVGSVLRDTAGLPFNFGTNFNVDFRLNLAPQITAIVPQPVDRNALTGVLTQRSNQIDVYFNNDDLDNTLASNPNFYRLLVTRGTVDPLDDAPSGVEITPTTAFYDAAKDKVVLTFSANIETFAPPVAGVADPAVAFRLRIGTNEIRRPNLYGVTGGGGTTDYLTSDPGSTFEGAANLKNVLARGLTSPQTLEAFINQVANSTANTNVLTSGTSVIIGQSIDPQYYNLTWPGGNEDPGHRDVFSGNHPGTTAPVIGQQNRVQTILTGNDILENHLGNMYAQNPLAPPAATADSVNGITTYYYNFRTELGYVPDTSTGTIPNQPTFNIITDRQKQRAREVLEVIGQYSGVNFVETEQQGFIIATGDMRSILTTVQTGAGGLTGLAGTVDLNNDGIAETAAAIMDSGEDWASNGGDLYGNAWFVTAMHEIQELLGLGHSYDLPSTTVQGSDPALNAGLPAAEPVFPGDADIEHMQHVFRPESKDIDLYKFDLDQAGVFTAEVFAERLANSSQLDSALSIYRVNPTTQLPELYARNDDYFSKDAFLELELPAGTYYVGVSASGNIEYDPNVFDSGMGGTTQGVYQLKLDYRKTASQTLTDNSGIAGAPGVAFDGDADGKPGGVTNFWFDSAPSVSSLADLQSTTRTARTIFVDRAGGGNAAAVDVSPRDGDADTSAYIPDGSINKPFLSIKRAIEASKAFDIIRIVGNNLAATIDTADPDLKNNLAYQIGFDRLGNPLPDGSSLDVPKDRTVMIDAGAVIQLRRAQISVGSENQGATADRSGSALQVLGTPFQQVYFTSYNRVVDQASTVEPQIGKPENSGSERADEGDWGGIAFRNDIDKADGRFDYERRGIFMNYISNADIRYGGGQVVVNSTARTVNPIHLTDSRPTISNNRITFNADAAMSANPDSFEESNFSSPQYGSTFNTSFNVDYNRVGPDIHGNILTNNTVNALSIRSRTQSGALNANSLEEMSVTGRFDDTDIVHVIQENLVLHSNPGGALVHSSLSAPGTTLTVASPTAGVGGFAAGSQSQIEYKIVYIDENGNEGLASNTVKVTGTITAANSYIRLTNLPNVTASLLAQGFVGRRLYRRVGNTGDFLLVEQIPASSSSTYVDKNIALPTSALRLKVASNTDSTSPRIAAVGALPAVAVTPAIGGGQYAAGTRVVYGLAWVDTEGRDTPMVELPIPGAGTTLGPNGSVTLSNLPAVYGQYMGLRIYRSIAGGQFDLISLVDAGANSFVDTGAPLPLTQQQAIPSTVDITATIAPVPPPAGGAGFTNGQIVNYRFTYFGSGGETASSALAVTAGESRGFVINGNNRQITVANLPDIDDKQFSSLQIYRSINYGRFELVDFKTLDDQLTPAGFIFVDTNVANPAPTYLTDATLSPPMTARARPHGTLVIDPEIVMKSDGARIDATIGTSIIAEGVKGRSIVMTSLYDTRYGAGGTFATSKTIGTPGTPGDWAGIYFAPDSKGSFNEVVFAYGGGENRIEGTFTGINVLEIQQAKVRVANSRFEFNESGVIGDQAPADRSGRGPNDEAVIFVRGAQPVIINNVAVSNQGSFININANGMSSFNTVDFGRQTGLLAELPQGGLTRISYPVSRLTDTQTAVTDVDNNGPLIRLNKLDQNEINGMVIRGGVLTTETVWDDTDIAHVLFNSILIPDFHTYGGLRLESNARESLVIKAANDDAAGTVAGFIADGRPLEIEDRIGGTLQVLGQPGFPVVMTSFSDDTVSAGLTPQGKPQSNTNGDSLLPPLPTIGEVNNNLTIDNDVAQNVNGHFGFTVGAAGALNVTSTATAQGLVANYIAQNLLTNFNTVVYTGAGAGILLGSTMTVAPFLNSSDEVISRGVLASGVAWTATSRFGNGSTRLATTYDFTAPTGSSLGAIRLINYLDQNIGAANNDIVYLYGSPGQADFRLLTLDNTDRIGFAQGGIYQPGTGLTNAKYVGFGADKAPDLLNGLTAGTYNSFAITANPTGAPANIDLTDLPLTNDRALGNVYGQNNATTAMAWDVSPLAASATITTYLEFFPRSPIVAGSPGEWQGITINQYANDRNVETVPEREPVSSNGSQNSRPSKAQFLGSLATANKGGDENLRLGFVVQGAISTVSDVDIYSFKSKSETEVWFDIDRTSQALDSVVELVDEFGNVLARSDNSVDESSGADSLVGEGAMRMQKTAPYDGLDLYSTNVRDAGMRIKLPGPPGVESTYFVRVRSVPKNKVDLDTAVPQSVNESLVTPGVSFGAYELQIRLRETDEKGGTTIRYSKIANAVTGIDVNGLPTHSPLGGEQRDEEPNNIGNLLGAQELGNLLSSDRGAVSIGGSLNTVGETDWYTFTLDYTHIDGASPVQAELPSVASLVNTVFDLDYADGLGRPNMQMFVFDSQLNMILSNFDSNIADDRGTAFAGGALSDLGRGSVGFNDSYIGNVALPASTPFTNAPQRYYVAVTGIGTTPAAMDQFTNRATTNPRLRLEPLDSVKRIVEDHLSEGTWDSPYRLVTEKPESGIPTGYPLLPFGFTPPDRGTSSLADVQILFDQVQGDDSRIPWHLGDTTLYVLRDSGVETTALDTFNPFTGTRMTTVGGQNFDIRDIDFVGNNLVGLTRDVEAGPFTDAGSGNLIQIATTNGGATNLGDDKITTYVPQNTTSGTPVLANNPFGVGIHYDTTAYAASNRLYGVGKRGEDYLAGNVQPLVETRRNIVQQLNSANGTALVSAGAARDVGDWTDAVEAGEILTEFRFTAAESTNTLQTAYPSPIPGYVTTRVLATNPNVQDPATGNDANIPQLNSTFNIRDGEQITVTDGDTTRTLEFDAGFDYTQNIQEFSDTTVRDGYYFILDRDADFSTAAGGVGTTRNETIFQFDTGPVLGINSGINSASIPDQATFVINGGSGTSIVFEFDRDGKTFPGNIPIAIAPAPATPPVPPPILTAPAIASLVATAINSAYDATNFPVTAYVSGGSSRISLFHDNPGAAITVPPNGFSDELLYADPISQGGTNSIPFQKMFAQGAAGAAPVLQALPQPVVPGAPGDLDGRTFTITQPNLFPNAADIHVFEFQPNGSPTPVTPGRIPVNINYGDTGSQVAAAMQTAIRTLSIKYGITANQYNNDDRVVVNGLDVNFTGTGGPIINLMDAANGGLTNLLINAKEAYPIDPMVDLRTTNQRIADAIMNTVNLQSQFIVGAEGATLTGRVNFPPVTNVAGHFPVVGIDADGMPVWTAALDDSGVANSTARPGVSTGAIPIPFLAQEWANIPETGARQAVDPITGAPIFIQGAISPLSISDRVVLAINSNLTQSTGITARAEGPYVYLNRGRITLPAVPNSPFQSDGPQAPIGSNPPGGEITGMVYLPEISDANNDRFLAVSDKGGLYEVTVDWFTNTNAPLKLPSGAWNPAKYNTVTTRYIGTSEQDLTGLAFQGLTRGPGNVEIDPATGAGRYANTWFAVADGALVPPPTSIVAPAGSFLESEQNNSLPTVLNPNSFDESFVTYVIPNPLSGNRSIYQSTLSNATLGNGIFGATSGDYDFYRLQASAGEIVTAEVLGAGSTNNRTLVDSYITIYNSAGTIVAQDDNSGNGFDAKATFTVPVNGTGAYYVSVRSGGTSLNLTNPFSGATGSGANFTGTYGLTITRQVDEGSRLHAFAYNPLTSAYTGMQPIFADGNTSIPLVDRLGNPIQDAVGLHFGELDSNQWKMTPYNSLTNAQRQYDLGHGTIAANADGSRVDADGHSSFYFGRTGVGTNYDFNNGAAGSIISNEFDLEGYSAIDQPALYFTYFSDHEQTLYDSLRLFISGIDNNNADTDGDGVADTNSGDWFPLAFDDQASVPVNVDGSGIGTVGLQQTFTSTGSWRQVRVPLDQFAGMQGLRLRFDFSTAGDMDVGNTDTTGEEIRTVSGEFITDGQFLSISGQTFELNSGVTATFSSGRATPDGETITLTDSFGATTVFEFDKDGVVAGTNSQVIITDEMSPREVAQALLDALLIPANSIVSPQDFFENELNNTLGTADDSFVTYQVPNGQSATQSIYQSTMTDGFLGDGAFSAASGDYDFFKVTANDGEGIIAEVLGSGTSANFTLANSYITIYNSAGVKVAGDDNSGPGNDALARYQVPAGGAGDYFVVVRSGGTSGDLANPNNPNTGTPPNFTGSYGLRITRTSPLFAETSFLGTASTVSDAVLTFHGVSAATQAAAPGSAAPTTAFAGAVGLNDPNAIELPYRRDDSRVITATTLRDALEQFYYDQQMVVNTGANYTDGQLFDLTDVPQVITGQTPALPTTTQFEFEAGEIIDFPDDGGNNLGANYVVDGDTFQITWNNGVGAPVTRTFEFDTDGIVTVPNVRVPFRIGESDTVVVNSVVQTLLKTFPGMQARVVSNSRVQLDTDINPNTTATFSPAFTPANGTYTIIGAVGVAVGNTPVYYTESNGFSVQNMAARVANAITSANIPGLTAGNTTIAPNRVTLFSAQDYILNPNNPPNLSMATTTVDNVKQYEDLVRLISTGAEAANGTDHFVDFVGGVPQRGPFGWEADLPGDLTDAQGGMASPLRGQNNNFEGVYLDDFVIGLAERGEMSTGMSTITNPVTMAPPLSPLDPLVINQVRLGDYQLEIRRGVGYDFVTPGVPSFTPDSNDRFTTQQTLLARSGAEIVDGQTFTISDGNRQLTFEFNDINQFSATDDVVTPGYQEIPYTSTMKDYEVAVAIRDAINNVNVQQIISVSAWMGDGVQPGLQTTTNRVNLNGAATFTAMGVPVTEPNENIPTAMEITAAGVPYDGLRFFANGMIGDSNDGVTSQNDQGRRDRDVDYFGLDLVAGQRIVVDIDAATLGSTLDSYLRIFNSTGTLQNVTINGVTYTAENDGPTVPMLFPGGAISTVTFAAPGELAGGTQVIGNTQTVRPETDSALVFTAPTAGRYYIAVSGASNNRYNPVTGAGVIKGSTGTYQLEVTSPNATGANSAGMSSAIDVITYDQQYGDQNLPRDQGQLIIQGNEIYNSETWGVDIDAGNRTAADGNAAHQGGVRNLSQSNTAGLLTGVVVMNNVIYGNGTGAIRFAGDALTDAPVPYGRIINNTLYGSGGTLNPPPVGTTINDTGIRVEDRAGPTMLNNIIANFNTGIFVDASSRPNTVIGGVVTQGNTTLSNPANVGFGDFPILLSNTEPLFRNAVGSNFYLNALSRAIDSSVDSLLDRPLMVTIKAPLGIGASPILSPDRDSRGQVRADDPEVQTPQGFGLNPFKDRGAIDRVDKTGPSSDLINPQDNDSFGIDRDSADNVVSTDNTTIVRNFTIALFDRTDPNGEPDGSDIDDFTVTTSQVIVTRRASATVETVLQDGVDYFFSYDSTSNQIVLTPVGNVWSRGTYRVYLNDGILDQAGNKLVANNNTALPNPVTAGDTIDHYYDLFLGTAVDYGDAPATYPVLEANGGANHFIVPGVSIGATPTADFDGKPSAAATLDSDDGVVSWGALLPGVANASSVIVNAASSGIKLSMWIDNDGTVGWSSGERVIANQVLVAGNNTLTFTIPAGLRGPTYARLRVSSQDINSPTGPAVDGEVEDYAITLTGPTFQNGRQILVDRQDVAGPGLDNIGNFDVNDDGKVNAFDAIIIINYLNLYPGAPTFPIVGGLSPLAAPPPYLDTDGNGRLTAFDVTPLITYLNLNPLLPTPPSGPEFVAPGGGSSSAPESAGESVEAESPNLALSLLSGEIYASSSVVIENQPTSAQQQAASQSPVEEMMHAAATEAALLAMAERHVVGEEAHSQMLNFEHYNEMEIPAGPLTDGQWADLLDELALEQAQS